MTAGDSGVHGDGSAPAMDAAMDSATDSGGGDAGGGDPLHCGEASDDSLIGAPAGAGLTISAGDLQTWTGATTITPNTPGVVNGVVEGYLFTSTIYVSGNVTFRNCKFASENYHHIVVQGTVSPGPIFCHIEIDGMRTTTENDDMGITNSSRDNGGEEGVSVTPFILDRSRIYNLNNGARLDAGAVMMNSVIEQSSTINGSHTDGIEIYCGAHISIDHMTIDMTGGTSDGVSGANSAIEAQGDVGTGGFCPISYLSVTNSLLTGGTGTFRLDDEFITHVTVKNIVITSGKSYYFQTAIDTPSNVDVWENVKLSDGTVLATAQTYGCGKDQSCH